MGYTHYWYRAEELPADGWGPFLDDAIKVTLASGIDVKGGTGHGVAEFTNTAIWLNGDENCGHSPTATPGWTGCDGDCSHETFGIVRVLSEDGISSSSFIDSPEHGVHRLYFDCTKTAGKPYDLVVTAILIAASHHFGDLFVIESDGGPNEWEPAIELCLSELGYGQYPVVEREIVL